MIIHELLVGAYPFFFVSHAHKKQVYTHHSIHEYWYNCPEETRMFGDSLVMPVLQQLASRCLNQDPTKRP